MNKAFRLIWNSIKQTWVVAAEKVSAKGGIPVTVILSAALLLPVGSADALPTGAQVVNGTAAINTVGSSMTITNSPNAIINWQGFSIAANESTRFIQQSASSAVLNRVVGGNASQIFGTLQSNGKVFLINQNGILFGSSAVINVNGLVASTLNLTNEDFLAGRMKFSGDALAGKIENQGTITTPSGGSVYLIAPNVENSGVITAPNGDILLAAGKEVLLVDKSSPEIAVVATAPEGQALNLGTLAADAGRIGVYGSIVKHKGIISANSAVQDASGRIFLKATREVTVAAGSSTTANGPAGGSISVQATEGTTLVSGSVEARGAVGKGGTVQFLGQRVGVIEQAVVDASGATGGGTVLVGGDYQGKNADIQNAQAAYMGKDTVIKADATNNGNGGKIILWADDVTRAYGSISARGGTNGGDGGFVETSGKNSLDVNTIRVSTAAPLGQKGSWLLDPSDITITSSGVGSLTGGIFDPTGASGSISWSTIEGGLAGGNVTIQTSSGTGGSGDIIADDGYSFANAGAGVLTLHADRDIVLNRVSTGLSGNPQGLTLQAGRNVTVNNTISLSVINITANTGDIAVTSTGSLGYGTVSLTSTSGAIKYDNSASAISGSSISLNAATGIYGSTSADALRTTGGATTTITAHNTGSGPIRISDSSYGGLIVAGATQTASGQLVSISTSPNMTPNISITGAVTAPSGTVNLSSSGTISQSAAIAANSLTTSSVGGTILEHASNAVSTFSATNTSSGQISFKNSTALTIGSVAQSASNVTTIESTGNLTLGAITSNTGVVTLRSHNGSIIDGNSSAGNVAGAYRVDFNDATTTNPGATGTSGDAIEVSTLNIGGITAKSGDGGVYISNDTSPLAISGISHTGSSGDIVITSAGNITVPGSIVTTSGNSNISVSATGSATLTTSAAINKAGSGLLKLEGASVAVGSNLFGNSGNIELTANSGSLTLNSAISLAADGDITARALSGTMNIGSNITSTNGMFLAEAQNITHSTGTIDADNVRLDATLASTGTLTLQSVINAYESIELKGDNLSSSGADLNVDNSSIQHEITIRPHTPGRQITIGASGSGMVISDTSETTFSAPTLVIGDEGTAANSYTDASGAIQVNSAITRAGRLALVSGSNITQSAGAIITADEFGLITSGSGTITLGENNAINKLIAETDSGSITLKSINALTLVEVIGGIQNPDTYTGIVTNSGNVTLTTTGGDLTLNKPILAGTGSVSLTASGSVIDNTGGTGVAAASFSASAVSDIGSLATPFMTDVSQWGAVTSTSGSIYLENYGAVASGSSAITAASGNIVLKAHSPLTIGIGGVSAGGDITLVASASGGGDDLTLNGPVSAGGNLSLQAGDAIYENVTPTAGGTITRTANLNNPEQTPAALETEIIEPPLYGNDEDQTPEGLVLVAAAPEEEDDDKSKEKTDEQPSQGDKRDEKPKKNYCN